MRYIYVFLAVAALDFCWARYTKHIGSQSATAAAKWAALIMLGSTFTTISYTTDHMLAVPAIIGAYFGTYVAVLSTRLKFCKVTNPFFTPGWRVNRAGPRQRWHLFVWPTRNTQWHWWIE